MIVPRGTSLFSLIRSHWRSLGLAFLISAAVEIVDDRLNFQSSVFSISSVSLLITVLTIYLVLRVNQAYDRWWEARKLWGALVNVSRTFGRQVTTLLTPDRAPLLDSLDQSRNVQRELVYRHIAYVNALRLHLRRQDASDELKPFLSANEILDLRSATNLPAALVHRQATHLASILERDTAQQRLLLQFDNTLSTLFDIQGGCERIKNTAFPDAIVFFNRSLVWAIVVLMPLAIIEAGSQSRVLELVVATFMSCSFVLVNELGQDLKNPFENKPNDTPMTAICRTIEIDLRGMLGETEKPKPLEARDGVLM
jgi:putative membrane protein